MDISLIMKVVGIGIIVSAACYILSKYGRDEQAAFVSVAGIVVVLVMLVGEIGALFETIREVFGL